MSRKTKPGKRSQDRAKRQDRYVAGNDGAFRRVDRMTPGQVAVVGELWPVGVPVASHTVDLDHTAAHRVEVQAQQREAREFRQAAKRAALFGQGKREAGK